MRQRVISIDGDQMIDWSSFHGAFSEALGFPVFYGWNMNAWIDCLTYIDEGDGMSNVVLRSDEELTIRIERARAFQERCPEQAAALVACAAFVNERRQGRRKVLNLDLSR